MNEKASHQSLSAQVKELAGFIGLVTAIFSAAGFLAVRAYISGLGIPDHASISINGYLQHGGRFFFTIAVQLLIVSAVAYPLYLLVIGAGKFSARLLLFLERPLPIAFAIGTLALIAIWKELKLLHLPPVFQTGTAVTRLDFSFDLLVVETLTLASVVWLTATWARIRASFKGRGFRPLPFLLALFVGSQMILFPPFFGRTAMIPEKFPVVSLTVEKSSDKMTGVLAFSDENNYFLWLECERRLVQVSKKKVGVITYLEPKASKEL